STTSALWQPLISPLLLSSLPLPRSLPLSYPHLSSLPSFFFFNDTATTEIYTLSLHDALPIWPRVLERVAPAHVDRDHVRVDEVRSEEHTSELQSLTNLVCRLLLEKKKKKKKKRTKNNEKVNCTYIKKINHNRDTDTNIVRR